MNLSLASFLVEDTCRAVRVEYDPDLKSNNNMDYYFKTLDPDLAKDDLVIIPTTTRHKFTVAKIIEIDFTVNYDGQQEYRWIVGKVDKAAYDTLLGQDKVVIDKVGKIEQDKKKRELMTAMGITDGAVPGYRDIALPAPSAPNMAPAETPNT